MKASRFVSHTLLLALAGCGGGSSDQPIAWRLVDNFKKEMVKNVPSQVTRPEPAGMWDFSKPPADPPKEAAATQGWKVATAVSGLSIVDGHLQGRTTTSFPIIYVERNKGLDTPDLLYAVEIRMRADKGVNVSVQPQGSGELKVDQILDSAKGLSQPWNLNALLIAGQEMQTYTMRPPAGTRLSSIQKLLVRPSDESGAQFEIESVKIVSRREHLSLIPSGVGWQGLAEIYRETVVSRAPEAIELNLTLPAKPWLDLQIGTVEDAPVTFEVRVGSAGSNATEGDVVLQRTLTTPDRWEKATVDLAAYSGRNVVMSLALKSENGGALGFWGGTAIRDRGRPSQHTNERPQVEAIAGAPAPQGVIVIVADTLRKDHLNFHGYERETAPFLAKLGTQGAVFRDNVAQATWTKVSVPTIQSGMYPLAHHVSDVRDRLPASAVTIAEVYRDAGYATVGYSSVPFSGQLTNLHQGYEELHERSSIEESGTKTGRIYIDRLSEWLDTHRDGPFFVFLHVFDPHSPFEPRRPYNTMWADPAKRDEFEKSVETVKKFIKDTSDKNRGMPMRDELKESGVDQDAFMGYNKGWYDGSIRGLDAEITRLMEKLRSLGLADKTLLAFTSDHGEGFHEHGYMWHGQHIYGELTGVPLMFYGPSFVPAGPGFDVTTRSIDIAPTLMELSHLKKPDTMQGQSLVPVMAGSEWTPQPAISQKVETNQTGGPKPYDTESYSIVSGGWKLIHHTKPVGTKPEFELFHHADDPLDLKDLSAENPDQVKTLAALLESEKTRILEGALPEEASTENMSDDELQRLRSLGYIQ